MKNYLLKKIILSSSLIFGLVLLPNLNAEETNDKTLPLKNQSLNKNYLKQIPRNDYILGAGDSILVTVSRSLPELTNVHTIDGDGTVYLPRLHRTYVSGLTINELNNLLNESYKRFIIEPEVEVQVATYRPVRVYVDGEVENPGMYTLPGAFLINENPEVLVNRNNSILLTQEKITKEDEFDPSKERRFSLGQELIENPSNFLQSESLPNNLTSSTYFFPTVFDAIRRSSGITMSSDLENVEVIRKNSISNGGGSKKTTINFLSSLGEDSGKDQNIRIYDGDIIKVKKLDTPLTEQLSKAIKSNLNPRFINVFVSGRVSEPGRVTVTKSSTLTEAIDMAGGTKILKGPIKFIRYNQDGSIDKRQFAFRRNSKRGSHKNPYLKSGDLIFVGKSAYNVASEVIKDITAPFVGIYSTYKIFN